MLELQSPTCVCLPSLGSVYPPITSDGARQEYKQEFDMDLKHYKQLCAEMDNINDELNQLSKQLDSLSEDSPQYQVPGPTGVSRRSWGGLATGNASGLGPQHLHGPTLVLLLAWTDCVHTGKALRPF